MEFLVLTFLAAAIAVGIVKAVQFAWKEDDLSRESHEHLHLRARRKISRAFEEIVEPLRKKGGE